MIRDDETPGATPKDYALALVSFIDILGFTALVESASAAEIRKRIGLLQRFTTSEGLYTHEAAGPTDPTLKSFAFSDSIIRVRLFGSEPPFETVMMELSDLIIAQSALAKLGILVRGGMSAGDIYVEPGRNDIIFGPAFIRAYHVESKIALFPRIVLDIELVAYLYKFAKNVHADDGEWSRENEFYLDQYYNFLAVDEDGEMHVDYLGGWRTHLEEEADWADMLRSHRSVVRGLLKATDPTNVRVIEKLKWMKRYHNQVVKRCIREAEYFARAGLESEQEYARPKAARYIRYMRQFYFRT